MSNTLNFDPVFIEQLGELGLVLTISSSAFADPLKKLYLDLDQVLFDATGIYVEIENCYYKVGAIALDKEENRYYTLKKEAYWFCANCGKYNHPEDNNCWFCGWPWGPP